MKKLVYSLFFVFENICFLSSFFGTVLVEEVACIFAFAASAFFLSHVARAPVFLVNERGSWSLIFVHLGLNTEWCGFEGSYPFISVALLLLVAFLISGAVSLKNT